MKITLQRKHKKYLIIVLIATVVFAFGYLTGVAVNNSFAADGKADSRLLAEVQNIINEKFIPWKASSTPPTDKEFEYGMIKGYVDAYNDPYTVFFPPKEAKSFTENVQGSFGGVGMNVGDKDGHIVVISPLKDSPAMKAGIKAGDIIVSINDKDTSNMNTDDAVSLIRGPVDTKVKLIVIHKETKKLETITITRATIKIPTLETEKKNGVFVIHLYNFSAESPDLFKNALEEFLKAGTQYLIVDLRGNPGGYLEAAVDIASFYLPEGKIVVSEKQGKTETVINHRSKGYDLFNDNLRMVVMLDGGSASASEILAGALKDHQKATIVGEKSFGKGCVQELINLSDGSSLKVTTAKWFTPNGTSISENGIKPDVEVAVGKDDSTEKKIDTQLDKAIETVKNRTIELR